MKLVNIELGSSHPRACSRTRIRSKCDASMMMIVIRSAIDLPLLSVWVHRVQLSSWNIKRTLAKGGLKTPKIYLESFRKMHWLRWILHTWQREHESWTVSDCITRWVVIVTVCFFLLATTIKTKRQRGRCNRAGKEQSAYDVDSERVDYFIARRRFINDYLSNILLLLLLSSSHLPEDRLFSTYRLESKRQSLGKWLAETALSTDKQIL